MYYTNMKKTAKKSKSKPQKKQASKSGSKTVKNLVKAHVNTVGITPLGSRVLIKPYTKEELLPKNSFGIILPDTDGKEKSEQGMVLAVGPGEYRDGKLVSVKLNVGDKVIFSKYGYEDVTKDGVEYFLIKEENILAILQ